MNEPEGKKTTIRCYLLITAVLSFITLPPDLTCRHGQEPILEGKVRHSAYVYRDRLAPQLSLLFGQVPPGDATSTHLAFPE
jgi:hypothetical protein